MAHYSLDIVLAPQLQPLNSRYTQTHANPQPLLFSKIIFDPIDRTVLLFSFLLLSFFPAGKRLEEARRRKQDYATYYRLAVSYGPLANDQFELATYPGNRYRDKVLDASRVIQNWWWSVWPRLLRRRKAAALVIQSVFRGFVKRQKWHTIIRLKTLWGNTRIVAHGFSVWRGKVALIRRVRAFARRFRNRSKANCLGALLCIVNEKKKQREELLRGRLRRVSQGIRLRVFQGWLRYTETSLTVERLRFRSSVRPAFRGWREIACEEMIRMRLQWACAIIASRVLRWRERSRYVRSRGSCMRIQAVARIRIASARVKSKLADLRYRRAEEAVQALEVR